jgi:hypothetical protein
VNEDQYQGIMEKLGEIQGQFGEHKGRTEAELLNLTKRLDTADMWENVKIITVMPIMAAIHHFFGKNG